MTQATDTRERIIAAADALLSAHGADRVSLRQILRAASQSNMAAIGYYFGDRTGLERAVFRRRCTALTAARGAYLDRLAAQGRDSEVRGLVEAATLPVVELLRTAPPEADYARFAARMAVAVDYAEADVDTLDPADRRIVHGLSTALAHLPADVVADRVDAALTLIVAALAAFEHRREHRTGRAGDLDRTAATVIDMAVAGLCAPHRSDIARARPTDQGDL